MIPLPAGKWAWSAGFRLLGHCGPRDINTGQDFSATAGLLFLQAAAGIVIFTGNSGLPYGNLTQIQHPDGVQTWYAHQTEFRTKVGDKVRPGQVIGSVGATGNTTGPHLHFEVRVGGRWRSSHLARWCTCGRGRRGVTFDPMLADQLRADLAEAEAAANRAQQVAEINAKMAGATKKANAAQAEADQARAAVASHVREVYKAGVDPGWLPANRGPQ